MHIYKLIVALFCALLSSPAIMAGSVKKPTIMVLPSDTWCYQRYFIRSYEDCGSIVKLPDYGRAFQEDGDLRLAISTIGQMLTDMGYNIKDSEQELKKIATRAAENSLTTSIDGASVLETPLDILMKTSKSDIVLQLGWQFCNGCLSYTLDAIDSYTSKRIATSLGTDSSISAGVTESLISLIGTKMPDMDRQLSKWFDEMNTKGREITLTVMCWDNWTKDLESEFGDIELLDIIKKWVSQHTVNGMYNLSEATETFAMFEQVMIPLSDSNGVPIDARDFVSDLRKLLRSEPYLIQSKLMTKGLGEVSLILGGK